MVRSPLPRAFPESTIVLFAGGNLRQCQINTARAAWAEGRCRAIGAEDAYLRVPWLDALYSARASWWDSHIEHVREQFYSLLLSSDQDACRRFGMWHLPMRDDAGLSRIATYIASDGKPEDSAAHLVNIAVHLGARRLLLVGYGAPVSDTIAAALAAAGVLAVMCDRPGVLADSLMA